MALAQQLKITITSNEEMKDIMKIAQALEDFNILPNDSLKQLKMKQKNQKRDF